MPPAGLSQVSPGPTATATRPRPSAFRHRTHLPVSIQPVDPAGNHPDEDLDEYVSLVNTAGPANTAVPVYADVVETVNRDYSIGKTGDRKSSPQPKKDQQQESFPFVPNSSFSFQFTDTLPPAAKVALMEQLTEKEFRIQIAKLQTQLRIQLDLLREQENAIKLAAKEQSRAGLVNTEERQLKELLEQQMKFQQQYLKNLEIIQRQLMKASHKVTTVYI